MIEIEETQFERLYHIKIHTLCGPIEFPITLSEIIELWKDLGNFILTQFLKQYPKSFHISTNWKNHKLRITITREKKKRELELYIDEITPLSAILGILSEGIQG